MIHDRITMRRESLALKFIDRIRDNGYVVDASLANEIEKMMEAPTDKQVAVISMIERNLDAYFEGVSKADAREFISKYIDMSKSASVNSYAGLLGFTDDGNGNFDYDDYTYSEVYIECLGMHDYY